MKDAIKKIVDQLPVDKLEALRFSMLLNMDAEAALREVVHQAAPLGVDALMDAAADFRPKAPPACMKLSLEMEDAIDRYMHAVCRDAFAWGFKLGSMI